MPSAAIVHFSVRSGGGELRLRTWEHLLRANGLAVTRVPVLADPWWRRPGIVGHAPAALAGSVAVESLAWSRSSATRVLARLRPDVVVFVTIRALDAHLAAGARVVVLDHVDLLSESYHQRAAVAADRMKQWLFDLLAAATRRVERRVTGGTFRAVAAGLADARALGAEWVPILPPLIDDPSPVERGADRPVKTGNDVLFTGTLDYPPNVAALRAWRAQVWPTLTKRRPGARLVVGGRRPTSEVRQIVRDVGGVLIEDFDRYADLADRAAVAVIPLTVATGMQIKLLDAAWAALPIVATHAAMRGVDPDFPAAVAALGPEFGDRVADLLEDESQASVLGSAARRHVQVEYSVSRWAEVVRRWLPDDLAALPAQPAGS